jgi:hypothetical protein
MSRRAFRAKALVPMVMLALFAGCSEDSPPGVLDTDSGLGMDLGSTDLGVDGSTDSGGNDASMDAPMDVPVDMGPSRCAADGDCLGNAGGPVCDVTSGRCIGCRVSPDSCPADQHCDGASIPLREPAAAPTRAAAPATPAPADCAATPTPTAACSASPTSTAPRATSAWATSASRAAPTPAAAPAARPAAAARASTRTSNLANCGRCDTRCTATNATPACLNSMCTVGTCTVPYGDCDSHGEQRLRDQHLHRRLPLRRVQPPVRGAGPLHRGLQRRELRVHLRGGLQRLRRQPEPTAARPAPPPTPPTAGPAGRAACRREAPGPAWPGAAWSPPAPRATATATPTRRTAARPTPATPRTTAAPAATSARRAPTPPPACVGASCVTFCVTGFLDCDGNDATGCEVNVRTDLANCGACGRACTTANATPVCRSSQCEVASCNTGFANCDGAAANGCEVNLQSDVRNCGACGMRCPAGSNQVATCSAAMCGLACAPTYVDLDGDPGNGCECRNTDPDAPDDGFADTNCDGIDGVAARAIFVSSGRQRRQPGHALGAPAHHPGGHRRRGPGRAARGVHRRGHLRRVHHPEPRAWASTAATPRATGAATRPTSRPSRAAPRR